MSCPQRATSVEKEANGEELSQGCSTTENHNFRAITMETPEQSELAMDCEVDFEVDAAVADSPEKGKGFRAEQVCLDTDSTDSTEEKGPTDMLLNDHPTNAGDMERPDPSEMNAVTKIYCQDKTEALIFEGEHDELNRKESVTSSVSDTPSSADSVYENEAHKTKKGLSELESEPESQRNPEPEQEFESEQYPGEQQTLELEIFCQPEQDLGIEQYHESELQLEPKNCCEAEQNTGQEAVLESDNFRGSEQEPDPANSSELPDCHESDQDPLSEHCQEAEPDFELPQYSDLELYPEPEVEDTEPNLEDGLYENLAIDAEGDPGMLFEPPIAEESILEQCIREEAMSDVSSESCRYLDPDDMDECLRVEIAAASSDSETDEKWRTIFSSSINKEDDDSYLDSLQLSAQDLFVQKVEVMDFEELASKQCSDEVQLEVPQAEDVLEQSDDSVSFPTHAQQVKYMPLGLQGLSKISEDEGENGRDANHNDSTHQSSQHTSSDPNKKLPKDFCVIQETKSENVSTEHVDFQLARKQWREMEEQTKNKVILPTTKQSSFHGSHSFMYTPVRNIERTNKKAHDLESLNLVGDFPLTQFSPCSEDSGLDDSSYRSPYDDPETPIEREIRISMEREEHFRRERGISRMGKSTDCAPSRSIPRSISTPLTPSFIITSSPTKEPMKHEVSANNVVILDSSNDFSSRHGADNLAARPGEWHSEDNSSNLIILETSNLIIRSASDFSLDKAYNQPQEKMFLNNPFFKLRSRSTMSLVDEEIKMVKQREEELRKERANLYGKGRFNAERMLSNNMDTLAFDNPDMPVRCKSSPSSPMKTVSRMDRSTLSCDNRFPEVYTGGRRKSAMALRWEAGEFANNA